MENPKTKALKIATRVEMKKKNEKKTETKALLDGYKTKNESTKNRSTKK